VRVGRIFDAHVFVQGTPGFTIVSETTEDAPAPELRLDIERSPSGLTVSWPYQPYVYIVARTNLLTEYHHGVGPAQFRDFRWYIPLSPTNKTGFYTLRHSGHYYIFSD
jgi:hypothetical protein